VYIILIIWLKSTFSYIMCKKMRKGKEIDVTPFLIVVYSVYESTQYANFRQIHRPQCNTNEMSQQITLNLPLPYTT